MTSAQFNTAVGRLERFNDEFASWNRDNFISLERGNSILCGTDNDFYQKFCQVFREVAAFAESNPAARIAVDRSKSIFNEARRNGLNLTTGPFAGPL
ncbi:MAG: hypothetical protein ACXW4B_10695 [Micavibrio sp.]